MFFIGGIFQGKKEFEHFRQTIVCKKCGRLCSISVFMTYTCFSFFFIPLFKWGKQYYAVSNCCHTSYESYQKKKIFRQGNRAWRKRHSPRGGLNHRRHGTSAGNTLPRLRLSAFAGIRLLPEMRQKNSLKHQKNSGFVREKQTTVFCFLFSIFYAFYFMFSLFPSPFPVNAF